MTSFQGGREWSGTTILATPQPQWSPRLPCMWPWGSICSLKAAWHHSQGAQKLASPFYRSTGERESQVLPIRLRWHDVSKEPQWSSREAGWGFLMLTLQLQSLLSPSDSTQAAPEPLQLASLLLHWGSFLVHGHLTLSQEPLCALSHGVYCNCVRIRKASCSWVWGTKDRKVRSDIKGTTQNVKNSLY